jgi:Fic family protein
MPFPWDEDDPQVLNRIMDNLATLREEILASGRRRDPLAQDLIKTWHRSMLKEVPVKEPAAAGGFRGSGPRGSVLSTADVAVGGLAGVPYRRVRAEMSMFWRRLGEKVAALDAAIPAKALPGLREQDVIDLCAWAHGELVRIHPFANGNGRIARALVLWLASRYGLPAFIDLRPRPDGSTGYAAAARGSMIGRHQLTMIAFTNMLSDYRSQHPDS